MTRRASLLVAAVFVTQLAVASAVVADGDRERSDGRELRIDVEPDVRVDVEIVSGRIEIEGWDEDVVRIRSKGAEIRDLDIDTGRKQVSVRAMSSHGWSPFSRASAEVKLRIDVPRGAYVNARTVNGPIRAKDVEGRISFHAANGKIEVRGAPREAQLETINSGIDFEGEGSRVDARTVNGKIELEGVAGEVLATTVSGSIEVEGGVLERADLRTLSGSIELEARLAPGARVLTKSYSGSIRLELPEDTSARFEIQTFSGEIRNEFVTSWGESRRAGAGQRFDFEVGGGDGRVTIDTFSGSVRIRTRD